MAEVKCSTCGQLNLDDHNFCDHCGAPLFSFESLAENEPSLRDDLISGDQGPAPDATLPAEPPPPESEPRIPSDDSLIANLREGTMITPKEEDEASRLDDLIPPQPEEKPPASPEPIQAQ
jgi:hypothetical protein